MFQNPRKRAYRRGLPIHGYVGPNGGGKSAAMVWDTLPSLAAGRPALSTVRLLDYDNPAECADDECEADPDSGHYIRGLPEPHVLEALFAVVKDPRQRVRQMRDLGDIIGVHRVAHPLWIPLKHPSQVLDARGCDLLLDEVTGVASSRDSASMPTAIGNRLVQLRRNDVTVRWSSPSWQRADTIIRECSQAVTYCTGHLPKGVGDDARMWRRRRLFRWSTYDANAFEDFTTGKREELPKLLNDWHWGPSSPAFSAYDTDDAVLSLGVVNEAGTCTECGGSRRRPKCTCSGSVDADAPEGGVVGAGPRVRGGADDRQRINGTRQPDRVPSDNPEIRPESVAPPVRV